ncbi:hypothetical protein JXA80_10440, partial [bacterium]|nr:hypothetical protein [candidate division CSSED10-310 bacterium]
MGGLHGFLEQYGLWVLAFGAFFQGYSAVILAGLLVSQNFLDGFDVWVVSAVSAWIGHWFFFGLGRWLRRHRHRIAGDRIRQPLDALDDTIRAHPWMAVLFTQYGYGVRLIGAVAFGAAPVRKR